MKKFLTFAGIAAIIFTLSANSYSRGGGGGDGDVRSFDNPEKSILFNNGDKDDGGGAGDGGVQ